MNFTEYCPLLLEANGVTDIEAYPFVLKDGMGFGDEEVWWDSVWQKRPVPHEGIDLVQFKTTSGVSAVFCGFRVISPVSGTVVAICDDFLHRTVWLNPDDCPDALVLLSHVEPHVTCGQHLICGDFVGFVNYPVRNVPTHLHFSVLVGEWRFIPVLDWRSVHKQEFAHFVNPSI